MPKINKKSFKKNSKQKEDSDPKDFYYNIFEQEYYTENVNHQNQ